MGAVVSLIQRWLIILLMALIGIIMIGDSAKNVGSPTKGYIQCLIGVTLTMAAGYLYRHWNLFWWNGD